MHGVVCCSGAAVTGHVGSVQDHGVRQETGRGGQKSASKHYAGH